MSDPIECPLCGDSFDPYDGYRYDSWFHQKVNIIAEWEGEEPRHILSTGKYDRPVPDEYMGLL